MERGERFYKIHSLLRTGRAYSAKQLIDELDISRATFMRDIEYMRDRYQAPIVYSLEKNGYYYDQSSGTTPHFELPGLWFSAEELHALLTMHALVEQMGSGLLHEHVLALRTRLENLLSDSQTAFEQLRNRVKILASGRRESIGNAFAPIAQALVERRQVEIHYWARSTNENTTRIISPQRLVHYRGNWYVDAWCHLRCALRNFSVDTISQPKLLVESCIEIEEIAISHALGGNYGIISGSHRQWAELQFSPKRARWVRDECWHADQIGTLNPDGSYTLKVPYASALELTMDILKQGADVEVIAPPELRAQVAAAGQAIAARYSA